MRCAGKTEPLKQDPNQLVFVDHELADFGAAGLKGLPQYSLHCMINRQTIDLAPSAELVSNCIQHMQQPCGAQPVRALAAGLGSEQAGGTDRGIETKGSLLNLLANSERGSQYKLYVGPYGLPKKKGFGVRALEFIPAGASI